MTTRWVVLLLLLRTSAAALAGEPPAVKPADFGDGAYRWHSLPIEVRDLPPNALFVPVSAPVDFTALLEQLGSSGVVDEHSIRLYRLAGPASAPADPTAADRPTGGGREIEEPVQFIPAPQPRPKQRALLPGTPAGVSYLGEYRAGVTPEGLRVAGDLAWVARADGEGKARYRLAFGVRRDGIVVQVPYPPQDLKVFDEQGRATPVRQFPRMQIRPQWPAEGRVDLLDGRQVVTSYHLGPTVEQAKSGNTPFRRPFLYPVNGPDGVSLTEFGKPHDPTGSHAHHYSLWVAHNSVNGKDFWGEKGGIIAHEQLEQSEDGPVFCRLVQKARWIAAGADLLRERRRVTLYHTPDDFRAIDIDLEFTPAGKEDVVLGKTTFGFLAARVAQSMTVFDGGGEILNSRGDRNERGAHLKKADWIDQSGPVTPENWGGVAMLDHPDNPNHPTTWHCRNDGWAGAAFCADAPYTIKSGDTLRQRYRVVLHRGDAVKGEVARRYAEYSAKPAVRFGAVAGPTSRPSR